MSYIWPSWQLPLVPKIRYCLSRETERNIDRKTERENKPACEREGGHELRDAQREKQANRERRAYRETDCDRKWEKQKLGEEECVCARVCVWRTDSDRKWETFRNTEWEREGAGGWERLLAFQDCFRHEKFLDCSILVVDKVPPGLLHDGATNPIFVDGIAQFIPYSVMDKDGIPVCCRLSYTYVPQLSIIIHVRLVRSSSCLWSGDWD